MDSTVDSELFRQWSFFAIVSPVAPFCPVGLVSPVSLFRLVSQSCQLVHYSRFIQPVNLSVFPVSLVQSSPIQSSPVQSSPVLLVSPVQSVSPFGHSSR
jgi:hypothetical protein